MPPPTSIPGASRCASTPTRRRRIRPGASARLVARAIAATALERYPDARARELRARIAERTGSRPEELLVGTGSDEVIALLLAAMSRPRAKAAAAVVARAHADVRDVPGHLAHAWLRAVEVPLDAQWDLDVGAMVRACEMMSPNVVFIASPNNPTGNRMSERPNRGGPRARRLTLSSSSTRRTSTTPANRCAAGARASRTSRSCAR